MEERDGDRELRVWMREVRDVEVVSSEFDSVLAKVYLRCENTDISERVRIS